MIRQGKVALLAATVWAVGAQPRPALTPADPRGYVCYRAASPIDVNGRLDEAA